MQVLGGERLAYQKVEEPVNHLLLAEMHYGQICGERRTRKTTVVPDLACRCERLNASQIHGGWRGACASEIA